MKKTGIIFSTDMALAVLEQKNKYMELALKLAFEGIGSTSPNPSVGAVIVSGGDIVSTGITSSFGSNHAEIIAIKNAEGKDETSKNINLSGAEIFVSMEPCSHFGKTPPCADAIIKSGISRVYIPILDPNPDITGNGVKKLKSSGVDVEIMESFTGYAADLIRPFSKYINVKKPFIINKCAMTLDGRIATKTGDSKWISSDYSRYISHKLRAKVDAVIVGKNTFIKDNPMLNVRFESFPDDVKSYFKDGNLNTMGRENFFINGLINYNINNYSNPLRVLVGPAEIPSMDSNFFHDDNYLIFINREHYNRLNENGELDSDKINISVLDGNSGKEEITGVLDELYSRGIMLAMLEGGGRLAGSFLDADCIDQFLYSISPVIAGNGISPISSEGWNKIADSLRLHDISTIMIHDDLLYCGYRENSNRESCNCLPV